MEPTASEKTALSEHSAPFADDVNSLQLRAVPLTDHPLRAISYGVAIACFILLGIVVYRDEPDRNPQAFAQLSRGGVTGLTIWRSQNCHVCHQLYGFGGYLGPDLSHVVRRMDEGTLRQIVRTGVGPMPAIALDDHELAALYIFFSEIDASGQGHLEASGTRPIWDSVFDRLPDRAEALPGIDVFRQFGCGQCHEPFRLGRMAAPDLTRSCDRTHWAALESTIRRGQGNMPAFGFLSDSAIEVLLELLQALADDRSALDAGTTSRQRLPWFNYERSTPDRE